MRQEQNYFRQLIVWILRFTGQQSKARHAYEPLLPAVKTGQPHVCKYCKITIFCAYIDTLARYLFSGIGFEEEYE
jgi:hypothetical protein